MRPSARVIDEWRNRVAAEYRSAALTAQLAHWMIVAAFSEELVHAALGVVADELEHARLSSEVLVALTGRDEAPVLDARLLSAPSDHGLLAGLLDSLVRNFCLGETLAVPLFAAMRRTTTLPAARAVVTRVLQDETRHRQFGWDALDELLEREFTGVRARVGERLPGFLDELRALYAPPGTSEPLTDDERAAGLIDVETYREVFRTTVDGDLRRRFEARGIPMPAGGAGG